jgi:hypothetical protein
MFPETLVNTHKTERRNEPEDHKLNVLDWPSICPVKVDGDEGFLC